MWIVYADEILRYVHEGWIFYEKKKRRNESGTGSCGNNVESFNHLICWRTIDTNIFEFNRIEIIVAREEKLGNFEKLFDWLISKWSRIEKCGSIFKTVNGAMEEWRGIIGWINRECINFDWDSMVSDNLWLLYIHFSILKLKYFSEGILLYIDILSIRIIQENSIFSYNW